MPSEVSIAGGKPGYTWERQVSRAFTGLYLLTPTLIEQRDSHRQDQLPVLSFFRLAATNEDGSHPEGHGGTVRGSGFGHSSGDKAQAVAHLVSRRDLPG